MAGSTKPLDYGGVVVFAACPDDAISTDMAMEWVRERCYTRDDVAIKKRHGVVVVLALRKLW